MQKLDHFEIRTIKHIDCPCIIRQYIHGKRAENHVVFSNYLISVIQDLSSNLTMTLKKRKQRQLDLENNTCI